MVLEIITQPDTFFQRRADQPRLLAATGIMLLIALAGIAGYWPYLQATQAALPSGAGAFAALISAISVVAGVIGVLVLWLIYAGVFHLISAVAFNGDGSFTTTLALTGWGFVPQLIGGIIGAAVSYTVFSGVTFPSDPQQLATVSQQLQSDPLLQLNSVLGLVFLLWSAFLWTFAMKHGRSLTHRQATITVVIPVAIAALLNLIGLVGMF